MARKRLPKLRCSVNGCSNKSIARNLCSKHWSRWRKHGDPNIGAFNPLGEACSVSGCERKPHTRWRGKPVCNMHWQRLYNTGQPELREKQFRSWAICSVAGCDKDARTSQGSMCEMHYGRMRRYGSTEPVVHVLTKRPHSEGYVMVPAHGHPISQKNGWAFEHRLVLYSSLGEGVHACYWCKEEVEWKAKGQRKLVVDHLDGNKSNNMRENLVASCNKCNATRGLFEAWVMKHRDDPFLAALFKQALAA